MTETTTTSPIRCTTERDGQLERIVLDRPKGNVLDRAMMEAIRGRFRELSHAKDAKLLVFEGAGANFSFGASVAEHLPGRIDAVLPVFHQLFRELETLGIPTAAVVRGQCLGGGLELASWCGMVVCDDSARFGVPEVSLGVFPPVAALSLAWRVGGARAARLVLTGQSLDAKAAAAIGCADLVADDPEAALQGWFDSHLLAKSALALRYAWQAARRPMAAAAARDLPALEAFYLEDLMTHHDAVEGVTAFVERRPPVWKNE